MRCTSSGWFNFDQEMTNALHAIEFWPEAGVPAIACRHPGNCLRISVRLVLDTPHKRAELFWETAEKLGFAVGAAYRCSCRPLRIGVVVFVLNQEQRPPSRDAGLSAAGERRLV
jgi:hypothetical protein